MANEEQLGILKQGVDVWNRWRVKKPESEIDLNGADLRRANLRGADFSRADLSHAEFRRADLRLVNLYRANLRRANLPETDLEGAHLSGANLSGADFSEANLTRAFLDSTVLSRTDFSKTNLTEGTFGATTLSNIDLSSSEGLETTSHKTPSTLGIDTLQISQGNIPEAFLRGCGLSDWEIASAKLHRPNLSNEEINMILYEIHDLRATRPIQISPLFISYSHANSDFVDKIETKLNKYGVRFWRDIHNATAGRLEKQIDRAIRHNPTVLLILSEHSTSSDWVEHEARLARKLEKEFGRDVLCPVALDDSWKTCHWPERIKEQIMEYNILDFSNWEDDDELDAMFKKLIDGLDMFYKG